VKSFAAGLRKHKTNRRRHASERNSNRGRQGVTIGVIVSEQFLELGVSFYWSMYQKVAYAASKSQSVAMLEALGQENEERGLNIKKYCIRYAI